MAPAMSSRRLISHMVSDKSHCNGLCRGGIFAADGLDCCRVESEVSANAMEQTTRRSCRRIIANEFLDLGRFKSVMLPCSQTLLGNYAGAGAATEISWRLGG